MGGACSVHCEINAYILVGNPERRDHSLEIGIDRRILF